MILQTATLGRFIREEKAVSFVINLNKELPVVSIITPVPDVPSLVVDSEEAFRNLLRHLIDDHGEKKLTGFDNTVRSIFCYPNLTTVEQGISNQSYLGAKLLSDRIDGEKMILLQGFISVRAIE